MYAGGLHPVGVNLGGQEVHTKVGAPPKYPATMPRTLPPAKGPSTWPPGGQYSLQTNSQTTGSKIDMPSPKAALP